MAIKFRNTVTGEVRDIPEGDDVPAEVYGWLANREAKRYLEKVRDSKRWTELREEPKPRAPRKAA